MKNITTYYLFCVIVLFCAANLFAQNNKINNTTQVWSEADLLGRINTKWKWQTDIQYSRQSPYEDISFVNYNEQLTIRPWLHFYPNPKIKLSTFIGLWYNYPITEVGARAYPEYRAAIQAQFYKHWKLNTISNRFRTELREIKDRQGVFETVLRERYAFKYMRLIHHDGYDKNSIYFFTLDEFFVNDGSKVTGYKLFDQNRIFAGIGYNITNDITLEAGYFNQYQIHAHNTNYDMNHIFQLSLIIDNITKGI